MVYPAQNSTSTPILVSIQVGKPQRLIHERERDSYPEEWETAIYKYPVQGPVWVGSTNVEGDGQADLRAHGGPDQAVMAYSADHYPEWRATLNLPELSYGAFGENFTISGITEETVCFGDVYDIGEVRVQVTTQRQPCFKLARRLERPEVVRMVVETGRSGWYLRVLKEGTVEAGQPVVLVERSPDSSPIFTRRVR
jgi:MOSC domain-containing protein YiiM